MVSLPDDLNWKPQLRECFDALVREECGICHVPGHRAAQCWINGAVYEWVFCMLPMCGRLWWEL